MNCYLNSLLLPWTALTTAFSLPQFRQRTVSFSGDGPERSLRHLCAMAAALHVGRTGTLFPVVKTWMASIHPLYALDLALWPALRYST